MAATPMKPGDGLRDAPDDAMTCCCRQGRHTGATLGTPCIGDAGPREGAAVGGWIEVALGERLARVDPRRLVHVRLNGHDVVRLDDVWEAGHLGARARGLAFDFVGEDGFRVRDKLPAGIAGQDLATGYACVSTRDLVWPPVPARPCFWRVKRGARIVAFEPQSPAR
jgi:hypothetical protein